MASVPPQPAGDPQRAALLRQGLQQYGAGHPGAGEQAARMLLQRDARDVQALGLLAMCLIQLARLGEAVDASERAIALAPREPMPHTLRARALRLQGRTEEALGAYEDALRVQPGMETASAGAAELLLSLKRMDEAARVLQPALSRGSRNHQVALAAARLARLRGDGRDSIPILEGALHFEGLPPAGRVDILFALADVLDEAGETERALTVVGEANRMRGSRFDPAAHRAAVARFEKSFTRGMFNAMARATVSEGGTPVFVVGLPRSGTTLIERMLGAHSQVTPCGELDSMQRLAMEAQTGRPMPWVLQDALVWTRGLVESARERYRECVPLEVAGTHLTDKMPANVMYLPLISLLFPEAPIIRCRRDPRDTAVSCWFQHFGAANDWAYDEGHLVSYFEDVERVYGHCRDVLGIEVLEVDYEALVEDPEPRARAIVGHVGLAWEDACLKPHEVAADARTRSVDQVNRPLYTSSVGRWKRYESVLGGMLSRLT